MLSWNDSIQYASKSLYLYMIVSLLFDLDLSYSWPSKPSLISFAFVTNVFNWGILRANYENFWHVQYARIRRNCIFKKSFTETLNQEMKTPTDASHRLNPSGYWCSLSHDRLLVQFSTDQLDQSIIHPPSSIMSGSDHRHREKRENDISKWKLTVHYSRSNITIF